MRTVVVSWSATDEREYDADTWTVRDDGIAVLTAAGRMVATVSGFRAIEYLDESE